MNPVLLPSRAAALLVALTLSHFASIRAGEGSPPFGVNVQVRGNLEASRQQFERQKKRNVAFIGGSITEMEGYRPLVYALLKKRFPDTAFTFTNAGIASTCSNTGAFRLERDVLEHGPVDLLFVEFAVNDDQDGHFTREECIRGMEGIIRHARQQNPKVDIVMTFFVNEGMLKTLQAGKVPLSIEAHESVAKLYEVPTVNVARQLAEEITAGTKTWEQYGGVHPGPGGTALCASMMEELFNRAWNAPLSAAGATLPARVLPKPMDPLSYSLGRFIDPKLAQIKSGWTNGVPDWQNIPGGKRPRFTSIPMLCATEPGAEALLGFEGTSVGAFIVAGPDAGVVEASVDGGPARSVNLFQGYSGGLHYPCTVMLGTDLKPGKHTLSLRISAETKKTGHAMRIMQFVAN